MLVDVQPTHIFHADWGTAPNKCWLAQAILGRDGRYTAHVPAPIQKRESLISSVEMQVGDGGVLFSASIFP
jgi:hypothetical protein